MARRYWLVKQEPAAYPFAKFLQEGRTTWDGVRNFQARNALREMRPGEPVLYYHSGAEKAVVGLARVAREAFPDESATEGDWVAVELEAVKPMALTVPLATIKADAALAGIALVKLSRLSVMELSAAHYRRVLSLGRTQAT